MTTPRFLVDPGILLQEQTTLTGAELHHLRVRRLRIGDDLILTDGHGHERHGVIVALRRREALVRVDRADTGLRESPLSLVLAQALLKGDKMDLVIEKATELGVREVCVFTSERSLPAASAARQARWQRVAQSATKQCQRSILPLIVGPVPFGSVLERHPGAHRLLFWEGEVTGALAREQGAAEARTVVAIVGPEGGFSVDETERAAGAGVQLVSLGPRVLRAETAALTALALCQYLWGDLRGREG